VGRCGTLGSATNTRTCTEYGVLYDNYSGYYLCKQPKRARFSVQSFPSWMGMSIYRYYSWSRAGQFWLHFLTGRADGAEGLGRFRALLVV
jgi:hypothetical protein